MKIAKTRFDYIFLIYLPFGLTGVLLSYFFLDEIIITLNWLMPIACAGALIFALTPSAARKPLSQPSLTDAKNLKKLSRFLLLQLSIMLLFITFAQALISLIATNSYLSAPTLLRQTLNFYQGGLWPWPFIMLVTSAIAYLGRANKKPALLKNAVRPVIGKYADNIIGAGIEIFIKQGLLFSSLLTIGILLLQIIEIIGRFVALPSLFTYSLRTVAIGILLLILLTNKYIQPLTRFFWQRKYSDARIILIFCICCIVALTALNYGITWLAAHFPHAASPTIYSPSLHKPINLNYWLLLSFAWWAGIAPLLAKTIAEWLREYSLRQIIIMGLLPPALFGAGWQLLQYYSPHTLTCIINFLLSDSIGILLLAIGNLLISAYLFRNPHTCGITSDVNIHRLQQFSKLSFIRTLWQLCACIIAAYLFTSLSFITVLAVGIGTPVFATLFSAILGALIVAGGNILEKR